MDALKEVKPEYPIIIRRAGPRDQEAKELVEQVKAETGLDITFYGEEIPMTESAELLMSKLEQN
jgi:citryl-CoA synthetase large subunit